MKIPLVRLDISSAFLYSLCSKFNPHNGMRFGIMNKWKKTDGYRLSLINDNEKYIYME